MQQKTVMAVETITYSPSRSKLNAYSLFELRRTLQDLAKSLHRPTPVAGNKKTPAEAGVRSDASIGQRVDQLLVPVRLTPENAA